ncbi:KinB-signaling pathway activation protein [Paenibacillus thermoaerophilus]|uniref:KinB-signaling pathway activation protein n=1 Tax=Paenibacillus thermoaerophilus TaxID=1215385 RepID=A0ABW2V416_9BACL|nr:KinB-signaling pathway activation protein [Paenibacillus thermoaerophilus]
MTLRKWGYLFWTTLGVGTAASVLVWIALKLALNDFVFMDSGVRKYEVIFMLLGGSTISVIAQMGFFAYLIVRYVALTTFRRRLFLWNALQIVLVLFALADLILFRERPLAEELALVAVIGLTGLAIGYLKVRATNNSAFVPTLFFMIVFTALEAVPSLQVENQPYVWFMVVTLLAANAWQIMQLHRILEEKSGSSNRVSIGNK